MTIEYLPVGIACNLKCTYCYQDPMRDAGNISVPRNWNKVKGILERLGHQFTVFGGEPLLAPIEHLEEVWKFGYEKYGQNGIQTNGLLITDAHIQLFKKYKVYVGVSVDGPGVLNSCRTPDLNDAELTTRNIQKLCEANIHPSLIVTIQKENASRFLDLILWLDDLSRYGVRHVNFHILEVEKGRERLSDDENIEIFLKLYEWSKSSRMNVEPFIDIRKLLTEEYPQTSCVWNHCDPSTTAAVQGVSPDGVMSNCGRTNKDGVNWVKADEPGFERYLILHRTPQECGGCRGCEYFVFCKGQCPGTAIDGDWRNRTADCRLWYSLFRRIEEDLVREGKTILNPCRKRNIEKTLLQKWMGNHGDVAHGDSPHGDSHSDHTDRGIPAIILNEPPQFLNP